MQLLMTEKVCIALAVYNNGDYLLRQIESLLAQSYQHFSILIRDDCSTDHSPMLIERLMERYPGRIELIRGSENLGAKGNFSALMQQTSADYLFFSDGDDVWHETKVEDCLALMKKSERVMGKETPLLIHTDLFVANRSLSVINPSFWDYSRLDPHRGATLRRLLVQNVVTGCTVCINRPLLNLALPVAKGAVMHDWWLALVAAAFGKIVPFNKSTVYYRQHGKNEVGAKNWKSIGRYWCQGKKMLTATGRRELRGTFQQTIEQAKHFLASYSDRLSHENKTLVEAYASLDKWGPVKRRVSFLKHRFFKRGLLKNAGLLFTM